MSYRCQICRYAVPSGKQQLRHLILRQEPERLDSLRTVPAGSILREIPVCQRCKSRLDIGVPLAKLIEQARRDAPVRVVNVEAEPVQPERLDLGDKVYEE